MIRKVPKATEKDKKKDKLKAMQTFKRGLPKLCVTDTYIKNKRANLHVKGEFNFPPYFLLKNKCIKMGIEWPEENCKNLSVPECYFLPASVTFTMDSQQESSAGAKNVSGCSPQETWIKAPWEFTVNLSLFVQSISHKWT